MFKTPTGSRTFWESSYFGGLKRVLYEYPFYSLNYDLYSEIDSDSIANKELSYYSQQKLVNLLFGLAFAKQELRDVFVQYASRQISAISSFSEKELKERLHVKYDRLKLKVNISSELLEYFVNNALTTELKTLFDHYGSSILSEATSIYLLLELDHSKDKEDVKNDLSKQIDKFVKSYQDKKNVENFVVTVTNVRKVSEKVTFIKDEILFAKKLYNLLDITHEPKPEVLKNLLQGNMDSEKLAEILSGNNRIHMNRVENQSLKPFKVIVLGDYSGSMLGERLNFQRKVMRSLFYLFNDLMTIEDLEFYGHSGGNDPVLYRFHSPEHPHFLDTFNASIKLEENYDGPVIEHIHKMTRTKSDKPVLLISLSDGEPSGFAYGGPKANERMKRIIEKIKRDNFVTVGIGMRYSAYEGLYQYALTVYNLDKISPIAQLINRAVKENLVIDE